MMNDFIFNGFSIGLAVWVAGYVTRRIWTAFFTIARG